MGHLYPKTDREYECMNDACDFIEQICPQCNEDYLTVQHEQYGKVMGCTNYPDCKYTKPE